MEIQRDVLEILKKWKDSSHRKPILLRGARQIGKTWVMETFGRECFEHYAYFDFSRQEELKTAFQESKSPERILKNLSVYTKSPLLPGKTLIIFDEIQECEDALNSLKYFCDEAPEYHVIAAGSLLGVEVRRKRMTVPVGKVKIIQLHPISFKEFLRASDPETYEYVDKLDAAVHLPEIILNKLITEYRRYMVSGGMPEAVTTLLQNLGMEALDNVLQDILDLYEIDFSKYADPQDIVKIHSVWHSLPSQLGKSNKKFIYNVIKKGARAKEYENALLWLEEAGMIYRIFNISKPGMPLSSYSDPDCFKVYACDCGLLRRLANLDSSIVINPVANYTEFKGSVAENAVLQSLLPKLNRSMPYYWSPDSRAELEFVLQWKDEIIPVEVKAERNIKGRSLSVYNEKFNPKHRIRFSFQNLQYNSGLLSCPSPLAEWFDRFLQ